MIHVTCSGTLRSVIEYGLLLPFLSMKSTQQTRVPDYDTAVENKHLHMTKNNKNTKRNFKTQNTLGMPKTWKESSYVFEKETGNKRLTM